MKKCWKKCLCGLLSGWMLLSPCHALTLAELEVSEQYTLVDFSADATTLYTAKNIRQANQYFDRHKGEYENLAIVQNGQVVRMEYGIVAFLGSDKCDVNVEFKNAIDNSSNYTNACYGLDAAYLDTSSNGQEVSFLLSGTVGEVNRSKVQLIPTHALTTRLTSYAVIEGRLYHQIKQSLHLDLFSTLIDLGQAPAYLENGQEYLSYDGHYFYPLDQFNLMIDDLRSGHRDHSLNAQEPYYNYYQYVSHRTLTHYSEQEIEHYFRNQLKINGQIDQYYDLDLDSVNDTLNQSQYYGNEYSFFQTQYEFGSNALMMLALSMNETATGRSSLAFTRNNLFGHAAYDSDVEKNASRYNNVFSSVYSHGKYYISGSYCNPLKFQFHGGFFGNKANGMNVSYASDPYWGEKAAQYYLRLDEALGSKDFGSELIGIKTSTKDVPVYLQPNPSSYEIYSTGKNPGFAFTILASFSNDRGDWYKVQADATINEEGRADTLYHYDFVEDVGFVRQSDLQLLIGNNSEEKEFVTVTFDAKEGVFNDGSHVKSYRLEKGKVPSIEVPVKENALFTEWSLDIEQPVEVDTTYVASYRGLASVEMLSTGQTQYEYNDRINLRDTKVLVTYEDGETEEMPVTTSMVSGFDFKEDGDKTVKVQVGGMSTEYTINVSVKLDEIRQQLKVDIQNLIDELENEETYTDEQIAKIMELKKTTDEYMIPFLTITNLRAIDLIIRKAVDKNIHYVVKEGDVGLSVSGLSLSILFNDSFDKWLKDTYKITSTLKIDPDHLQQMIDLAQGQGFEAEYGFTIKSQKNLTDFSLHGPVLMSVDKPEGAQDNQLFTVLSYQDGNIVKCYTKQTDSQIQFMSSNFGEFLIVSRNTTNTYHEPDRLENINATNSDTDVPGIVASILTGLITMIVISIITVVVLKRRKKKKMLKRIAYYEEQKRRLESD